MRFATPIRLLPVILSLVLIGLAASGCAGPSATESPAVTPAAPAQPAATQPAPSTETPATATQPAAPQPTHTFVLVGTPQEASMPTSPAAPRPQDPYRSGLIDQALQDLAGRLQLPVDQITFVQFEAVVWPDGSLGCPQPDMAYTQVMVEGYRIRLQAGGTEYDYHGGGRRPPFLCESQK